MFQKNLELKEPVFRHVCRQVCRRAVYNYLRHNSGLFQANLRPISSISQASYILGITLVYLSQISGLSQVHHRHISGVYQKISQATSKAISLAISQAYLRHISSISQVYLHSLHILNISFLFLIHLASYGHFMKFSIYMSYLAFLQTPCTEHPAIYDTAKIHKTAFDKKK